MKLYGPNNRVSCRNSVAASSAGARFLLALVLLAACSAPPEPVASEPATPDENLIPVETPCDRLTFETYPLIVCSFAVGTPFRLALTHPDGAPMASFDRLVADRESAGETVTFAMNAGMYHDDRRPVGLYIEEGVQRAPLVTSAGPGNFGLLPNGVFYLDHDGRFAVMETLTFAETAPEVAYATQSGPMLVINGELHPAFNADGPSRLRRNGVGVSADGQSVYFVISETPINFHTFARVFRDALATPNALYLDGVVSRLYAPNLDRNELGLNMGPIIYAIAAPNGETDRP